jgi:outer membrane lipoprotein carrier protein
LLQREFIETQGTETMKKRISFISVMLLIAAIPLISFSQETTAGGNATSGLPDMSVDDILKKVEEIYTASEFSADFIQVSTIKAMEISDSASGKLFVKYPGKMRWEYQEPEPQVIISDGIQLWVFRPEDQQVMVGAAATFFGEGKGAGFLSDIQLLRKDFDITLEDIRFGDYYNLKLIPREKNWDLARIHLLVSKKSYYIFQVYTYNAYDDATRIEFLNLHFGSRFDDDLFTFVIPEGVDVLKLDE